MRTNDGLFNQQPVPPTPGNFPIVESITNTPYIESASSGELLVDMPPSVVEGHLLILLISRANFNYDDVTTPTGWTFMYSTVGATGVSYICSGAYKKVSDGTEGGVTLSVSIPDTEWASVQVFEISQWGGTLADVVAGVPVEASATTSANPPSLTSGFGAADTLWIAVCHATALAPPYDYPSDYTDYSESERISAPTVVQTSTAQRRLVAATENPGPFLFADNADIAANTIAIKGG